MNYFEIPFKKLTWESIVNEKADEDGVQSIISIVKVNGNTIFQYGVSNILLDNEIHDKFYAFGDFGRKLGQFDTIEAAINCCQIDFQSRIIDIFFDY